MLVTSSGSIKKQLRRLVQLGGLRIRLGIVFLCSLFWCSSLKTSCVIKHKCVLLSTSCVFKHKCFALLKPQYQVKDFLQREEKCKAEIKWAIRRNVKFKRTVGWPVAFKTRLVGWNLSVWNKYHVRFLQVFRNRDSLRAFFIKTGLGLVNKRERDARITHFHGALAYSEFASRDCTTST